MAAAGSGERSEHLHRLELARGILSRTKQSFENLLLQDSDACVQAYYRIANTVIRIVYRESLFEQKLLPALDHLKSAEAVSCSATIFLAGPEVLGQDWSRELKPGSMKSMTAEGYYESSGDAAAVLFVSSAFASVSCLDKKNKTALFGVTDLQALPPYETAAPLRVLLYWLLALEGKQAVHAAGVGTLNGAVLIAGRGGSGKSNTSLACLSSGLLFGGDDYMIVDGSFDPPRAYSFFASTKLFLKDLVRHPALDRYFAVHSGKVDGLEKMAALMTEEGHERVLSQAPVKAVLIPSIVDSHESFLEPMDRGAALKELAPSTLFQFPGAGQPDFQRMAGFVRKVPCYRLLLGRDAASFTVMIRQLCEDGRASL